MANPARVEDYLSGGRDNYVADRTAAQIVRKASRASAITPAVRAFHQRAARYLAADAGIRQFLHVGTGLGASGNTHEVTQSIDPACRIVYAGNGPIVMAHARDLLHGSRGTTILEHDALSPGPSSPTRDSLRCTAGRGSG